MEITRGKIIRAQRCVITGVEGIGKSLMASLFPNTVFIDVEDSTHHMDVARYPKPMSFEMLRQTVEHFKVDTKGHQTLVIDTADWAERLGIFEVCAEHGLASLGGAKDWGKSYNLLEEKWAKFLDLLTDVCMTCGVHIVMVAHATTRKFELPEEGGAFDKWELKLNRRCSMLLKEWADLLLFYAYKTIVVEDDSGKFGKSKKGQGGNRVIRTSHHPCWDAKNRHGLPNEISVEDFPEGQEHLAKLPTELYNIFYSEAPKTPPPAEAPVQVPKAGPPEPKPAPTAAPPAEDPAPSTTDGSPEPQPTTTDGIPPELLQLMETNSVTEETIRKAVAYRGHYTEDTPITNYDPKFVTGVLIAAWPKVMEIIAEMKKEGVLA